MKEQKNLISKITNRCGSKKFLIFLGIFFLILLISQSAIAGTEHNISGWAWSERVGWISFNCYNDYNGDGVLESHCTSSNYGVNIDRSTGLLSGHAWAGGGEASGVATATIGWISFNKTDLDGCPSGTCEARLSTTTGKVSGWARALAATNTIVSGGWDGWIKLNGTTTDGNSYGVSFNTSTKEFEGWAAGWDDTTSTAVIGWISFNCKDGGYNEATGEHYSVCGTSNYKVFLRNSPPTIKNLEVTGNPCAYKTSPLTILKGGYTMRVNWNAQDPDGDPLTATINIVGGDTNFSTTTTNKSFIVPSDAGIKFNTSYTISLEVSDGKSSVSTSTTFKTPLHQYPYVNFKFSPEKPLVNQLVQFCSVSTGTCAGIITQSEQSECYAPSCTWNWTFTNATPSTSNLQNPQVKFTSTTADIVLKITSDVGSCEKTEKIQIRKPLPRWELMKLKIENFFASLIESFKKFWKS